MYHRLGHTCGFFRLFLLSALGEKDVGLNECGSLLGSIIFCHGDQCCVVLSMLPPVSGQWLWEQADQVRSLSESPGSIREISVFVSKGPSQNECGINPKD